MEPRILRTHDSRKFTQTLKIGIHEKGTFTVHCPLQGLRDFMKLLAIDGVL